MRQRHACRDAPMVRLVGQVVVPQVGNQRPVDVQAAFLDELHCNEREDGLGHRTGLEGRLGRHGPAAAHIAHAEALRPYDFATLDDRD
jgi:hypothetical protein